MENVFDRITKHKPGRPKVDGKRLADDTQKDMQTLRKSVTLTNIAGILAEGEGTITASGYTHQHCSYSSREKGPLLQKTRSFS